MAGTEHGRAGDSEGEFGWVIDEILAKIVAAFEEWYGSGPRTELGALLTRTWGAAGWGVTCVMSCVTSPVMPPVMS